MRKEFLKACSKCGKEVTATSLVAVTLSKKDYFLCPACAFTYDVNKNLHFFNYFTDSKTFKSYYKEISKKIEKKLEKRLYNKMYNIEERKELEEK